MEDQEKSGIEDPREVMKLAGGRDELNLAEFPITLLSDRVPKGCNTLVFEIEPRDRKSGQLVSRKVTITGSDAYGLPTALDDEILVALIQLTKLKNDFENPTVPFSRYELVNLLGWPDDGKSYRRIEESIRRWVGVTLYYDNAWWNKETGTWVTEDFHIIERCSLINKETKRVRISKGQHELALSSFKWNEVIFRSFQAGSLKRLDIDAYFSYNTSIAKRMYRFLDKRFWIKNNWEFDLKEFAFEHIGLSRNYDVGQVKNKLQPGIDELTECTKERAAFIEPMSLDERYVKIGKGQWLIRFERKRGSSLPTELSLEKPHGPRGLVADLVSHGVALDVAEELVRTRPAEFVSLRIEVFEWAVSQKDRKVIKENPTGYLISSIRDQYLTVPAGFVSRAEREQRAEIEREKQRQEVEAKQRKRAEQTQETAYQGRIKKHWNSLSAAEQAKLDGVAIAQAHPDMLKAYESSKGGPLEAMAQRLIREAHIRKILGIPEAPPAR